MSHKFWFAKNGAIPGRTLRNPLLSAARFIAVDLKVPFEIHCFQFVSKRFQKQPSMNRWIQNTGSTQKPFGHFKWLIWIAFNLSLVIEFFNFVFRPLKDESIFLATNSRLFNLNAELIANTTVDTRLLTPKIVNSRSLSLSLF